MDLSEFWKEILSQLQSELASSEFEFWFSGINYVSSTDSSITLKVPSSFYRDKLKSNYLPLLVEKFRDLAGRSVEFIFEVDKKESPTGDKPPSPKDTAKDTSKEPVKEQPKIPSKPVSNPVQGKRPHPTLREDMSFDTFVIGENEFAYSAAKGIAQSPGEKWNPFLIYGGVGMGKTHLMQAIGNAISEKKSQVNVIYVPANTFIQDFVDFVNKKSSNDPFKKKYRNADVLLLDDIHEFQKKYETQEELFQTFKALIDAKKQMVFTCDRPPTELKNFNERLQSRFTQGLTVELGIPSWETRKAILMKKSQSKGVHIPEEVLELIARNVNTNVRDLEAALNQISAYAELVNKPITLEVAQAQLRNIFAGSIQPNVTIDIVQRVVSDYYNVSTSDLKGKKRNQAIVLPRQVAMYLIRELTEYSTTEVGLEFGGRDHTTVMHACQKVDEKLKTDPGFEGLIQNLIRSIKEHGNRG